MLPQSTLRTLQATVMVLLLLTDSSLSCGPGPRIGGGGRMSKKMTPLVYKQHVPNVSENTLGASGAPEGAIKRTDPRFRDLVENNNVDILIRDEEGDGSDRIMTKRCKEKLNTLAIHVQQQWPGNPPEVPPVKLKVKEAWDENNMHGENSLHYEGRAVDVATSDRDRSKLGMLARLAVQAGFDWVYYESHGHIHCSVKSDNSAAVKTGGCFHATGIVQSESRGKIQMSDLRIGERVLSMGSGGTLEFSEVMTFMDREENRFSEFYNFVTESGHQLTLTAKHLVYVSRNNFTDDTGSSEIDVVYAEDVQVGQILIIRSSNSGTTFSRIVQTYTDVRQGVYAPLTKHGTIMVDDVIVSCYAYINSEAIAHFVFAPMRLWYDVSQYLPDLSWASSDSIDNEKDSSNGMHWYAQMLYNIGTVVLSKDMMYVH